MAKSIEQLIEALGQKEVVLAELLRLMEEERRCIVELDMASLELQVEKKKEALARLQQCATLAKRLMAELASELELPKAERLSALLPKLVSSQREELQELQRRLLEQGALVQSVEATNKSLLEGALGTVNRSLEFFGRLFSRSNTYGEGGRMVGGGCPPRLLRREA
jgi:flagellar biosynthesis/type III secretory pathway chaperone